MMNKGEGCDLSPQEPGRNNVDTEGDDRHSLLRLASALLLALQGIVPPEGEGRRNWDTSSYGERRNGVSECAG